MFLLVSPSTFGALLPSQGESLLWLPRRPQPSSNVGVSARVSTYLLWGITMLLVHPSLPIFSWLYFFHPKVGEKFLPRDEPGFSWKFTELVRRKVPQPWGGGNGVGGRMRYLWVILMRVPRPCSQAIMKYPTGWSFLFLLPP